MEHPPVGPSGISASDAILATCTGPTALPFDSGRRLPAHPRRRHEVAHGERVERLLGLGDAEHLDPVHLVEALWALLLSRHSGEPEVVLGRATLMGTAPVGISMDGAQPLLAHARVLGATVAYPGASAPFDSAVGPVDATGRWPLALFVDAANAALVLEADGAAFDADALAEISEQLCAGLDELLAAPSTPCAAISMLSDAGRELVLRTWNRAADEPDARAACVHERVAAQASSRPDAVAVRSAEGVLSYAELERRANTLARRLVTLGVAADDTVAVCLSRSSELVVALLAILKAGGAYLPIEPSYPAQRVAFMLSDARPRAAITESALRSVLGGATLPVLELDRLPPETLSLVALPACSPEQLAYVLYTSGSTGTPKGVLVPHRAIDRLVWASRFAKLGPDVCILQAAPVAFDASTFEIWGALVNGGSVAIYPDPVPTAAGLKRAIAEHGVTTLWLTAALFNAVIDDDPSALAGASEVLTGGEALSVEHVRRAQVALPKLQLIDGYGPTETTTFATCFAIPRPLPAEMRTIPIGSAIRQTRLYVLDSAQRPLPVGAVGELYIGGEGLARGYLARPELTAERFLPDPFVPGARVYRTGDIVRFRPDGVVDYVGRRDQQVKVRGFRIELGEVEAALIRLPGVRSAVVVARAREGGDKQLVAYVVPREGTTLHAPALRAELATTLPEYMVPALFVTVPAIPITLNGKVDYRALPEPGAERPELAVEFVPPRTPLEEKLARAWADALGIARIGMFDNLFELGASSLLVVRTLARLEREQGLSLPVLRVFESPNVAGMAGFLNLGAAGRRRPERSRIARGGLDTRVAIVGMAGRFPGARTVRELWEHLCDGVESISFFERGELDPHIPASVVNDPAYVRARGIMSDVDLFDAGFFGITPKEAALMDPQQRVLLEVAWETLESAGHVPETYDGAIGVFAGKYNNSYYAENVVTHPERIAELGAFQTMVANEKDYIATRIAHRLGLTGPAISVHTACSTSLVAVVQAYQNLVLRQCDMALAGGVSITVPVKSGYLYQEGAMLSADGHTRSFDADAQGTVFSDGAAMVLLKRLDDALADGDTIHAVLVGAATNNDGAAKASFTAPSVEGQASVIGTAQAMAGVSPTDISYVEAHGTATPLGDPIEVEALTRAFRASTDATGYCALGSVKSNLGHLVIAAGATGLIKTALCLRERTLVPTLHYKRQNPKIDFARTPFFVNAEKRAWTVPAGTKRVAGVSSFGVGGTNAHVIVEEPPAEEPTTAERSNELLVLSARSESALAQAAERLAAHLAADTGANLHDVSFTLLAGRKTFAKRRAVVAKSTADAVLALRKPDVVRSPFPERSRVAFMFPGQGAQHPHMGRTLYREQAVFRAHVDAAAEVLRPMLGRDLRTLLFPAPEAEAETAKELAQTSFTQPALYTIEHALAQLWLSFGIVPDAMIGHSVGEFVAATLAGVMRFEDALKLVAARGQMMQEMPAGAMLSVRLGAEIVAPRLPPDVTVAADNSPSVCVVAGGHEAVARVQALLEAKGAITRLLQTSHAFHSAMMEPVVPRFEKLVASVPLSAPTLRIVSTATGDWLTPEQALSPRYWAEHVRATVRFGAGVAKLLREPGLALLEVGPRGTLATLARQQVTDRVKQVVLASLGESDDTCWNQLLSAAGQLWALGVPLDARGVTGPGARRRVPLPTYPFEHKRYWVEPRVSAALADGASSARAPLQIPTVTSPVIQTPEVPMPSARREQVLNSLSALLEEASGLEVAASDAQTSFVELGLDSLFLTQFALALGRRFDVKITFRQLLEHFPSMDALAEHIESTLPAEALPTAPAAQPASPAAEPAILPAQPAGTPPAAFGPTAISAPNTAPAGSVQNLIQQQLTLMAQQLALLSGSTPMQAVAAPQPQPLPEVSPVSVAPAPVLTAPAAAAALAAPANTARPTQAGAVDEEPTGAMMKYDVKKAFGAIARITTTTPHDDLTPLQRARLDAFTRRYNEKTKGSKRFAQEARSVMADPRAVTGFRPAIKELIYPIVVDRSEGARMWDVDGNEYVDALNGFGLSLFGWQPDFVTKAIEEQLHKGHEIGPQHPLQLEVAKLVCEVTGFDRAGFCNTGSEAVMGCARIARTVTGRPKIAIFTGGYHGIFDEVVVRGTKKLRSIPAAPGIMPNTSENVIVLDYGTDESLEILKSRAHELAAVIIEPVQSRRPDFQPREFIHAVRDFTAKNGIVMVFDEVVTGFRAGPGGAQDFYGVRADLASYGKVVGGGLPIGVIAGKREFMDALDGGFWQFGDDSVPPVGVTYFAGTFVRHPLALAAAKAVLNHIKEQGPSLQKNLNARVTAFAGDLNAFAEQVGAPFKIKHFASLWKTFWNSDQPFGDLLFYMMRDRGVHIYDGFPCFYTTAHGEAEFAHIAKAFKDSILEMQDAGFLPERKAPPKAAALDAHAPPVPGARLGRDPSGNPAWYVPHPSEPNKYVKLEVN